MNTTLNQMMRWRGIYSGYSITKNKKATTMDFFLQLNAEEHSGFNLTGYGEDKWGPFTMAGVWRTNELGLTRVSLTKQYSGGHRGAINARGFTGQHTRCEYRGQVENILGTQCRIVGNW